MNGNQELLDALKVLHEDEDNFLEKIEALKKFRGPSSSVILNTPETARKAKDLRNALLPGKVSDITQDGPPRLDEIIEVAKLQLVFAENLKRIKDIKADEDISSGNLKYLNSFFPNPPETLETKAQNFCNANYIKLTGEASEAFQKLLNEASVKIRNISENTKARSKERIDALKNKIRENHAILKNAFLDIENQKNKIEEITESIATEKSKIISTLENLNAALKAQPDKVNKEAIQKQIDNHNKQIELLDFTQSKLKSIQDRLEHRYEKAHENIRRDFFYLFRKITRDKDLGNIDQVFAQEMEETLDIKTITDLASDAQLKTCYYQIGSGIFNYKILNPDGTRDSGTIELPAGKNDITTNETKQYIIDELAKRRYIATNKYQSFVLGNPNAGIAADEKELESLLGVLDDLNQDVKRCERAIHLAELTAKNPDKQLHTKLSANTFMDVMSLADINSFNKDGKPYFRDEIFDEKNQETKKDDLRTKFGLEGEVVTRGVMCRPGEVVRSSYINADRNKEITINTKFVKSKLTGEHSIAKTELIWRGNLTPDEKKQAAFRYARKLLLQYTEGDSKSKITIKAGRNQPLAEAQEQANMVYAAILMLTSEETAGKNCIKLPSDKLNINVKGVGPDLFGTWPWKRKKEFISKHFNDDTENMAMGKQVTEEYRMLRKVISKDNKKATIDETATDDVQHVPLKNK